MSLNSQIQGLIHSFNTQLPPEVSALIEQGAGQISALPIAEKALNVGDRAPDYGLKNYDGELRQLQDYLAKGPLVLTFYRGLWCPYCNLQLASYNQHLEEIRKLGADLVAIAAEGPEGFDVVQASEMPAEAKATLVSAPDFDVLHDEHAALAKAFGLTFSLPQAHRDLLAGMKVDVERATGDGSYTFADPATYIIGTDGIIRWAFIPNNYRKRAEPEAILKQLKTL